MNARRLLSSSLLPCAFALSACAARTLDVGAAKPGTSTSPITYVGGCAAGSCGNQEFACAVGTAVNLQCAPDPFAGQGSDPAGHCTLTGQCATADAGACPTASSTQCSGGVCAAPVGGGGYVSVERDGASAVLAAYFNHGVEASNGQPFGACVYNPYGAETAQSGVTGAAAPNPGVVSVKGPALDVSATPACSGLYAPVTTAQTFAGGDLVTLSWKPPSTDPDTFPSSLPSVPAPHLVSLAGGQAFALAAPTIPRGTDVAVTWTVDGTPMALEQVVVLLTQGVATVRCAFDASMGSGVVPADALLKLAAAEASYAVFSQHQAEVKDSSTSWDVLFELNAVAATPAGLAKGTVTLQ
jgi:hypothetical protein